MKHNVIARASSVAAIACGAALLNLSAHAQSQAYPTKPLRMMIPAGPSGGVDTISRLVGQRLGAALGQPVIMDNRPGAGTMLASELLAKSPPDGYTMLMVTNSHTINASLHKNLRYDPIADFTPVTLVASIPYLVVVHPSVPARSVRELIALAKKRPGELLAASAGTGSGTHLAFELFASMANVNIVHVPYKSGSPAIIDLIGGHVQLMFSNMVNSMPHVRTNRLRALAITSGRRSSLAPELPTVAESGLPGYQADLWYGVLLPARAPDEIVNRLNREIVAILDSAEIRAKAAAAGAELISSTPQALGELMRNDIRKWARVTAGLKIQGE
jgi:tripartite-type tricarboxylate transporter receptor subunit TctC